MLFPESVSPFCRVVTPFTIPNLLVFEPWRFLEQHQLNIFLEFSILVNWKNLSIYNFETFCFFKTRQLQLFVLFCIEAICNDTDHQISPAGNKSKFIPNFFVRWDLRVIYRLVRNTSQMSSQKTSFSLNHSCVSSKQLCPCFLKQNGPNFLISWMNKCRLESAIFVLNAWHEIIDYYLCCNSINVEINDIDAGTVYFFGAKERIYQFLVLWDWL